jgi:malonate-semialdehyde dehydrogenase (acetylating) / methylmalonate-semialdehyde dehydrogenase
MGLASVRNYVAGQWCEPAHTGHVDVENPSTGDVIARTPLSTAAEADHAVDAAAAAFPQWRALPAARRVQPLFTLAALLRQHEERLSRTIAEEMGKSLTDARAEVKRAMENCEVACGTPMLQQGDKLVGASFAIDGEVLRLPLGVCALAGPFNFPCMVPFWFFPYAVAAGNTFVIKPSERVPLTMQAVAELIAGIDLPPGVFNLVNGDRVVVDALLEHPAVKGFSLVGASATCRAVAEKCARHNKRCQAMGSAKNHLVVMPDARVDDVIRNMITSCYGCAGQRCMAASVIVAVGAATYRTICQDFVEASRHVIVADPLDPSVAEEPTLMGPVISAKAKRFILDMIDTGVKEGASLALDGRGLVVPGREKGHFVGPTIFVDVRPGMQIHQTEIFGPVVAIMQVESFDEAVQIINAHPYGNGASIYTQDGYWARRFKLEVECGMIGVNVGIPAPVAQLPFGGMKASLHSVIKAQGRAVIDFFTVQKVITERYWAPSQPLHE